MWRGPRSSVGSREVFQSTMTAEIAFGCIDWVQVDKLTEEISGTSAAIARVDIGVVNEKIAAEKKKLKSLCAKHAQACEELARARKSVQKERSSMMEIHTRLEQQLASVTDSKENAARKNQIKVELVQIKHKIDAKRKEHNKYIEGFQNATKKRERMIKVQGTTLRNLLHRKLSLAERASSAPESENFHFPNPTRQKAIPTKKKSKPQPK